MARRALLHRGRQAGPPHFKRCARASAWSWPQCRPAEWHAAHPAAASQARRACKGGRRAGRDGGAARPARRKRAGRGSPQLAGRRGESPLSPVVISMTSRFTLRCGRGGQPPLSSIDNSMASRLTRFTLGTTLCFAGAGDSPRAVPPALALPPQGGPGTGSDRSAAQIRGREIGVQEARGSAEGPAATNAKAGSSYYRS